MDLGLKGQRVLVTGASRGIGLAIAEAFSEEGCALHLVSRTETDLAVASARMGRADAPAPVILACDAGREGSAAAIGERFPDIDILINNAGGIRHGELLDVGEAEWRAAWELKVFGYINLTREYYRRMRERGAGVIVNVIGLAAERLDAGYIVGSSGNAALVAFTRALGSTSIDSGVRILGVNPGWVETDKSRDTLQRKAVAEFGDAGRWRELISRTLGGARMLQPREIADVVVFAASERGSGLSGHVITVDAGVGARQGSNGT
ncbi:MAG: short-chain dehydrogenase/reductase [Rhizobiaceae bacterium]